MTKAASPKEIADSKQCPPEASGLETIQNNNY